MSHNSTTQRSKSNYKVTTSPFKQRQQTNAPEYNKRVGKTKKTICVDGEVNSYTDSHYGTNSAKNKLNKLHSDRKLDTDVCNNDIVNYHNDLTEADASCARPDVLSIDSDFSSGNGIIDSPEQGPCFLQISTKNLEPKKEECIGRESLKHISANLSYCTPPSHMVTALSRVPVEKKELFAERKSDRETVHKPAHHTGSSPVTSDHNQRRQGVYGRMPVNGQDGFVTHTSSQSGSESGKSSKSSKSSSQTGSDKQKDLLTAQARLYQGSEDMDMRYTDITHMQLKRSLDQIQNSRSASAPVTLSSHMYNGISSNACYSHDMNGNTHFPRSISPAYNCNQAPSNFVPTYSSGTNIAPQSSKFDAILQVKDAMLQEKENVILKLRLQISSLQHQVQEGDAALRQVVQSQMKPSQAYGSTALHTADTNKHIYIQAQKKIHDLEQLLGQAECKISESNSQFESEKKQLQDKIKDLEDSLKSKEQTQLDFKKKQKASTERLDKYKKRVESLERYLGDLPTIEESNKLKTEVDRLAVERENLVLEISILKNKLEDKTKLLKEYELGVEKLRENENDHLKQIKKLQEDLSKLEQSKQELGSTERDELEDMRYELSRLQKEREDAARMLSGYERRMKQQLEKHQENLSNMQEKVQDAEEMSENLRRELFMKQQANNKVHTAMMDLSSQNQQLMDQKLSLQDRVKVLEKLQSNMHEQSRSCLRLQRETHCAVQDLKSVAQVLIQTAKGSDPNISALLGVRSDSTGGEDEMSDQSRRSSIDDGGRSKIESTLSVEQTNKRLLEVRNLRKDVEQLRTMLSNQYADSIGDNCITQ